MLPFFRWLMRDKRRRRWVIFGGLSVLAIGGIVAEVTLPPRHLPWHPLDIDERAGFSTDLKLAAIDMGPASWCERLIAGSSTLETTSLKPRRAKDGCGWSTAFHVASSDGVTLNGTAPYAMRCPLAAGAHIWLTSVDYRARQILGSDLARIHHAGTYSCRRMYGRSVGPMSQHAYANAWDVTGFELADGRVVSVQRHWSTAGPLRTFLHAVRDDACSIFRVVLGPDYNAEHHDHFHLDMGNGLRCK